MAFDFDEKCKEAFDHLKKLLIFPSVIQSLDWDLLFEIMCDATDSAVEAVLDQRIGTATYAIYYASKTLSGAQLNYITIENELLAVIFAF